MTGGVARRDGPFEGRTAVVTGGASGIGAEVVRELVADGACVGILDQDGGAARTLAREIGEDVAFAQQCDVTSDVDMRRAVDAVVRRFGSLELAVNNAGISAATQDLIDYDPGQWDRVIAVNLTGVYLSMRHELRVMTRGAAIVNMASVLGVTAWAGAAAYVASKHGVVGITRTAALEEAPRGIRVNAVGPGFIETPLLAANLSPEEIAGLSQLHPIGRLGTPREVAKLVLFLLSEDASFMTGGYHLIDGAYSVK